MGEFYGAPAPLTLPDAVASPFGATLRAASTLGSTSLPSEVRGGQPSGRVGTEIPTLQTVGLGSALPSQTPVTAPVSGAQGGWLNDALRAASEALKAARGDDVRGGESPTVRELSTPGAGGNLGAGPATSPTSYQTPNYWMGGNEIGQNVDPYNPNSQWKTAGSADQKFTQWANPAGVSAAQKLLGDNGIKSTVNPTNTEFDPFGTTKQAQLNLGEGKPLLNAGAVAALMNNPYYRDNPQNLKAFLDSQANPNALGKPGESQAQTAQRLAAMPAAVQQQTAQPTQRSATSIPQTLAALLSGAGRSTGQSTAAAQPSWMTAWNRVKRPIGYTSWNRSVRPTGSAAPTQTNMGLPSRFTTSSGGNSTGNSLMSLLSLLLGR